MGLVVFSGADRASGHGTGAAMKAVVDNGARGKHGFCMIATAEWRGM